MQPPPLPQFPEQYSIPPAPFFTIQGGLTTWLNQNSTYKTNFQGILRQIPYTTSTLSSMGYNPQNVPLRPALINMSQYQARRYNQEMQLFYRVYAYNSNAWVQNYYNEGPGPIYYTFKTDQERTLLRDSVGIINELYPFDAMAHAPGLNWDVPFPVFS